MHPRFIDRFDVILLDMGCTFMFDVDRFSDADDFGATYRWVGGSTLGDGEVRRIISTLFDKMLSDSRNPKYYDRFPSVLNYLDSIPESKYLPENEIRLLEQIFAMHEIGTVPETHVKALHQLHKTHQLGIVSNIWSRSVLYLREFERTGTRDLFDVIIFSSDYGHIKPSPYLFAKAIGAFKVDHSKIVFVGDSMERDIVGAKVAGLSVVWIDSGTGKVENNIPNPDLVIHDLRDLIER